MMSFQNPIQQKIVQNVEKYARLANISPYYILNSAKEYCTEEDFVWIINYLFNYQTQSYSLPEGKKGILYDLVDPIERFSYMIGILIRYLIDARLVNPYTLVALFENDTQPQIVFLYGLEHIDVNIKSQIIQYLYNPPFHCVVDIQDKMRFQQIYPKDLYNYLLNNYKII
jgi:hypothetical protein